MQQTAAAVLQSWSPPGRSHYVHRVQAAGTGGVQRMARRVVVMAHTSCSTLNINIFPSLRVCINIGREV